MHDLDDDDDDVLFCKRSFTIRYTFPSHDVCCNLKNLTSCST